MKVHYKLKLIHKFFFAFCITSFVAVCVMLALIMQNLSSGFHDFIKEAESSYIEQVSQKLGDYYQANGSWQSLKEDEDYWRRLVGTRKGDEESESLSLPTDTTGMSQLLQTQRRLSLYDANKAVVIGRDRIGEDSFTQSIVLEGRVIGWLSYIPSQLADHSPANAFLAEQYQSYIAITLIVIAVAFVTAWIFSRHLVAPIFRVNEGTTQLIQGNLATRVHSSSNDELGILTDNINVLAQTLEQNKTERSKWMSDVAHELKTPLTVVRGQLNAIQDGIFKADEKRLQVMIDQIDGMGHLVDDIYQLSSSDIGGLSYQKSSFNLVELVKDILLGFKVKTDDLGLSLQCESLYTKENTACLVVADRERLTQLFSNILENSCRYTNSPGSIALSLNQDKNTVTVIIEDTSPSIPEQDLTRVFERFYRVEQSRSREHGGSGIGLALCHQIIEAHQGTISASKSVLGGVKMMITLPIHHQSSSI
ncbi:two-component sensor histidine kinase [Vibrio sp. UCD-FRSSP16_10]|uniref:ATP-binding protein n=1 Tax=unclassified Vibrio TaxID=2614977 RepID=UPI0007FEB071|nr:MULTISPECIES: ATP-binding protein [unclassified Vibrio]OBT07880.1 two-component sensor histidine kinase [Vibrio sp. UCD-FRSSP16_30]OBT17056.1 two-component sensor histidine kinase [Vibrio sp. UCD-FRSSP16_10]